MSAPPLHPSPLVVLVDDVRSFRDSGPCHVVRSSTSAGELLRSLGAERIDHDLAGDETVRPVVRLLGATHLEGQPFDIGVIHVHASRSGAAHELLVSIRRAGYDAVLSNSARLWTW